MISFLYSELTGEADPVNTLARGLVRAIILTLAHAGRTSNFVAVTAPRSRQVWLSLAARAAVS